MVKVAVGDVGRTCATPSYGGQGFRIMEVLPVGHASLVCRRLIPQGLPYSR